MIYVAARARAQEAEESLNLPDPVSLGSIQRHLEELRGRTIKIAPMEGAPTDTVCGLWFGVNDMDVILHAPGASAVHRQQIILHEFAHMILRHEQERVSPEYAQTFFSEVDGESVITALKRSDFLNEFEITAEILADRLAARIRRSYVPPARQPANFGEVFG
ncbi:hypothetical protein [Arthrobacter sp. ES1]|uniref:hypothetical protein n=1 Tax=Arthrobacter sp. ES1 TaxID=1897056 RepID=UPI001CFFDABE|nr:hypothetical protein [Arthrobacter sp. ES1]MCB5281121.1 hypothetical protein [Arthrobacter sp. ES1]